MNNNKGYIMKKLLQLVLILTASAALSFTMVNATCGSGKDTKTKETNTTKPVPTKGKCGTGKCG